MGHAAQDSHHASLQRTQEREKSTREVTFTTRTAAATVFRGAVDIAPVAGHCCCAEAACACHCVCCLPCPSVSVHPSDTHTLSLSLSLVSMSLLMHVIFSFAELQRSQRLWKACQPGKQSTSRSASSHYLLLCCHPIMCDMWCDMWLMLLCFAMHRKRKTANPSRACVTSSRGSRHRPRRLPRTLREARNL